MLYMYWIQLYILHPLFYVYIYIYIYICVIFQTVIDNVSIYIYILTFTYIHTHIHMYIYIYTHAYTYTHIHIYITYSCIICKMHYVYIVYHKSRETHHTSSIYKMYIFEGYATKKKRVGLRIS